MMSFGYGLARAVRWVGGARVAARREMGAAAGSCATRAAVAIWLIALALLAVAPTRASAYCRESLMSDSTGPCVAEPGVPFLFWKPPRDCMTYRFNEQFWERVPLLSEAAIRQLFNTSFQAWSSVSCSGGSGMPFQVEQYPGTTATSNAEFLYDVVNESLMAARTRSEWQSEEDHEPNALALTLLWHDKRTGEILDVDMEFNTGAGRFTDCEKQRCALNNIDLQNTVTHEAGHVLGLGHSPVPGSTMEAATASNPEITKRTLEDDDKAGYCALELPEFTCDGDDCSCPDPPVVPLHSKVKTCGCRTVGAAEREGGLGGPIALASGAIGLWRRRRRAA